MTELGQFLELIHASLLNSNNLEIFFFFKHFYYPRLGLSGNVCSGSYYKDVPSTLASPQNAEIPFFGGQGIAWGFLMAFICVFSTVTSFWLLCLLCRCCNATKWGE